MDKDTIKDTIRRILAAYPDLKVSFVFGSLVKDRLTESSDIDIAVAAEQPLTPTKKISILAALTKALKMPVDLIDLQQVSGPILQQALCSGDRVFNKSPVLLAAIMQRMWYEQADMMPYVKRMLKSHCDRYING
jgi:uncharacterized protein